MCSPCRARRAVIEKLEAEVRAYQAKLRAEIDADFEQMAYDCCDCTVSVLLATVEEALELCGFWPAPKETEP